jgi:FKBP12-rapamycin complex-associated protein
MKRERLPEKVPFRLTKVFINALKGRQKLKEFKLLSEKILKVLRDNSDTLMALFEEFIRDPLINERLMNPEEVSLESSV